MKKEWFILCIVVLSVFGFAGCGEAAPMLDQAMNELAQQEYTLALTDFEEALKGDEDKEQIYRGMGLAYMGMQDYPRALGSFSRALAEAGIDPGELEYDINYYMAVCYYKMGEYDDAIACYDAITALKPKEVEAYYLKGKMKLCMNDAKGACEDFEKAVSVNKKDTRFCLDIYEDLLEYGYESEALPFLEMVRSGDDKNISDYDKGRLKYYAGDYGTAVNYLERARKNGDIDEDLILLLGDCYLRSDMFEWATALYSDYAKEHQNARLYNQLGLCYAQKGLYDQALEVFELGKGIKENNTCMRELCQNEIVCYERTQRYKEAAELVAAYVEKYGSSSKMEREYEFLSTR